MVGDAKMCQLIVQISLQTERSMVWKFILSCYTGRMCVVSVNTYFLYIMGHRKGRTWLVTSECQNTCVSSHALLLHTLGLRMNLCGHLSMSRILVYFFLIVSPSISFKLVLWISFSRNLKKVGCYIIDQSNQYFNQLGKPSQVPRLGCVTRLD